MDTREAFLFGLQELGVRARLAPRGRAEERIGEGKSLGLIELDMAPLQWANVREVDFGSGSLHEADLGVPDIRLAKLRDSSRIVIARNIEARADEACWSGEDLGLGLINALNRYPALNRELRSGDRPLPLSFGQRGGASVRISAHPRQRCWTITLPVRLEADSGALFAGHKTRVPGAEQLACYREIGRLLLNAPLSVSRRAEALSA